MKIWQKLYLSTLIVFLFMLNTGLLLAAGFLFRHNLTAEQEQAKTECYFLAQNLEHDFSILEKNGRFEEGIIDTLVQGYQNYYDGMDCRIRLKRQEQGGQDRIETRLERGAMTVLVERTLAGPYGSYVLTCEKELKDFEALWSSVRWTFAGISLLMSLLLCPLLYILLKILLRPLGELNEEVAQIAAGNYGRQITCRGRDEIAALAGNVSRMSEEIARQMAALREESRKKQQLTDNMAHELRTPLTAIYGYAEYLLRAKTSEEERCEGLSYIMSESMRLQRMGELMLSMRLYQCEDSITTIVNIQSLTGQVKNLLEAECREKEITLCCEMQAKQVRGEEELLINLFRNLLENAVRASSRGGTVWWRGCVREHGEKARTALRAGDALHRGDGCPAQRADSPAAETAGEQGDTISRTVVFTVEDQGVGMDEEELGRITEPFYRADRARSRAAGGAGLGLSIAEMIVKRYGGTMTFASRPGEGTRVTVELPGAPPKK